MNDKDLGNPLTNVEEQPNGIYWIVAIFKSGNKVQIVDLDSPVSMDPQSLSDFFRECFNQLKQLTKDLYDSDSIKMNDPGIIHFNT